MLLTCPSCGTRYLVDPASLGPAGRTVRCGRCAHTWQQSPPADMPRRVVDSPPDQEIIPPARNLPAVRQPASNAGAVFMWLLFFALLAVVVVGGYFGQNRVVAHWPPASHIYEKIAEVTGIPMMSQPDRLVIRDVTTARAERSGEPVLVIEGVILNETDSALDTPSMRVVLLDAAGKELVDSTFTPPQRRLLPGESAPFRTHIVAPPASAADVSVRFVVP